MNPKKKIETGMRVRVRHGTVPMTVRAISGDQTYCEWLAGPDLRQGTFTVESLEAVQDEDQAKPHDAE